MTDTETRAILWTDTFRLSLRDLVRYAGASGDLNPIHYDAEFAKSRGLPGTIVHGMFSLGIIARLIRQHAPEPVDIMELTARFGDVLVPGKDIDATCTPGPTDGSLVIDLRHRGAARASVTATAVLRARRT